MDAQSPSFSPPDLSAALAALAARPFVRFLAVGTIGLAADAAVFSLLHGAGLPAAVARALSLAVATGVTWSLNRAFTFAATGRRRRDEILRYALVVGVAQGISYGVFLTLYWTVPRLHPLAALLTGAVIATAFSFTGQRLFTFRARRPRQP